MRNIPDPNFKYSGLTIILDKPSRFDLKGRLCSGFAGQYFDECLMAGANPAIHRESVEVRTLSDSHQQLLADTKCLLLLGEDTLKRYLPNVTLNEQRGAPFRWNNLTCIASYTPQDSYDRRDYFSGEDDNEEETSTEEAAAEKSTHGATRRKNWRFWMRQDVKKAVRLTTSLPITPRPTYHIRPDLHDVVRLLSTTRDTDFYFDIENDKNLQMTCFGFSFDDKDIYVVPMLQTHVNPKQYYYNKTHLLLRAIAVALRNNRVVIHNSMYDLFVLAWRYGIPIGGRVYDTMLAWNRCYIEVEKSLGHVISATTDLPYHKNEGVFEPHNESQNQQLLEYNGKDVFALTQIKPKLELLAKQLGATESVDLANRMVNGYLPMILQGMNYDEKKLQAKVDYNLRKMVQVKRILRHVTGQDFNPRSWQQVSSYLYDGLGIKKPEKDPTNEKTLLQLLLKYEIPAIHGILAYRQTGKQNGKLKFNPFTGLYKGHDIPSSGKRFTCSYNLAGSVTMRLSSRKLLRRWGDNSQNFEKELRKVITPDSGKVFLQIDQAGAEALIVAYLCRPGQFRDIFIYGINPHSFLAMHLFQKQFEAELGYSLSHQVSLPAKELVKDSKWKEIAKFAKATDDWEGKPRYYYIAKQGNHCVDVETEVLTKDGWKKVTEFNYDNKEPIAVFNKDNSNISFESPITWNRMFIEDDMLLFENKMTSQLVTKNHTLLFHVGHGLKSEPAQKAKQYSHINIPTSGLYIGGSIKPKECIARLIVATQADGCIYGVNNDLIRFRFVKNVKAERLKKLLDEAHLSYTQTAYEGDCPFVFMVKGAQEIINYFQGSKVYGKWMLDMSAETLDIMIDELKYWDGYEINSHNHKRTQCSTSIWENADWLKTVIHLRNKQSCVITDRGYNGEELYIVSQNKRRFSRLDCFDKMGDVVKYKNFVYCPTVSTGFFVIRRNGKISITGNSLNYDARARMFRVNTLLKSEGSVAMSMETSQAVIDTRNKLFPEIGEWQRGTVIELKKTKLLRNLFGHPRIFTGIIEESMYKEAYAFKSQSTVGQITNYAITEFQEKLNVEDDMLTKAGADVLQNNHDSMLVQCYPEYKEQVAKEMQERFNRKLISSRGEEFFMKSDVNWSEKSWGEMQELKLN